MPAGTHLFLGICEASATWTVAAYKAEPLHAFERRFFDSFIHSASCEQAIHAGLGGGSEVRFRDGTARVGPRSVGNQLHRKYGTQD